MHTFRKLKSSVELTTHLQNISKSNSGLCLPFAFLCLRQHLSLERSATCHGNFIAFLRVINVKFPLQPHQKYNVKHYEDWLFIPYSDERWLYYQFSLPVTHTALLCGWDNILFELGSERVNALPFWNSTSTRVAERNVLWLPALFTCILYILHMVYQCNSCMFLKRKGTDIP